MYTTGTSAYNTQYLQLTNTKERVFKLNSTKMSTIVPIKNSESDRSRSSEAKGRSQSVTVIND